MPAAENLNNFQFGFFSLDKVTVRTNNSVNQRIIFCSRTEFADSNLPQIAIIENERKYTISLKIQFKQIRKLEKSSERTLTIISQKKN